MISTPALVCRSRSRALTHETFQLLWLEIHRLSSRSVSVCLPCSPPDVTSFGSVVTLRLEEQPGSWTPSKVAFPQRAVFTIATSALATSQYAEHWCFRGFPWERWHDSFCMCNTQLIALHVHWIFTWFLLVLKLLLSRFWKSFCYRSAPVRLWNPGNSQLRGTCSYHMNHMCKKL